MAINNLGVNHLTPQQKTDIDNALSVIENSLMGITQNLSAEERQKYGSINETNKLIVNKAKEYRASQPALSSPDVDWVEFQNDFDSRDFLQSTILRLQSIIDGLNNNKILHDYDNYQAALTDYDYSKYKASTKAPGFENKVSEMSQFFNRTGTTNATKKVEENPTS